MADVCTISLLRVVLITESLNTQESSQSRQQCLAALPALYCAHPAWPWGPPLAETLGQLGSFTKKTESAACPCGSLFLKNCH